MASLKTLAVRALGELLEDEDYTNDKGWYLKPSEYADFKDELDDHLKDVESSDTLARFLEAALAADNADLFDALYKHVGWEPFEDAVVTYFGLFGFFVYSSSACLTVFLDLQLKEAPDVWAETCEERLFDELEMSFWDLEWTPPSKTNALAIFYLFHFKGGISATSLLKKCIHHDFSALYAPLRALGARFEVDDIYSTNRTTEDLRMLLSEGLLETMKADAAPEDWAYLVEKLLE